MASSNPIFKEEDLAALEVETEKAAALAKAARRAMNLNILANVVNYSTSENLCLAEGSYLLSFKFQFFM